MVCRVELILNFVQGTASSFTQMKAFPRFFRATVRVTEMLRSLGSYGGCWPGVMGKPQLLTAASLLPIARA